MPQTRRPGRSDIFESDSQRRLAFGGGFGRIPAAARPVYPSAYQTRDTATRIAAAVPDARLIVLLRDPAERAFLAFQRNRWAVDPTRHPRPALARCGPRIPHRLLGSKSWAILRRDNRGIRAQNVSNGVVANGNGELPQKGAKDPVAHQASQAPIGARKCFTGGREIL